MSPEDLGNIGFHEVSFSGPLLDAKELRNWWHNILRHHGHYKGYLLFLTLPSNEEANRYLRDFGQELHLITGKKVLVIILTDMAILRHDFDKNLLPIAVNNQVMQGHSLKMAEQFGVKIDEFPCMLFFENISSSEHILLTLKQLTSLEIAAYIRNIIDVINAAVKTKSSPSTALKQYLRDMSQVKVTNKIFGALKELPIKTLSVAIETWLKSIIQ
jgi:hypothetical protein